jgi:hypothetical protein
VTRREIAFLMIGLGVGLTLAVVAVMQMKSLYYHMFLVAYGWDKPIAIVPFLLVVTGLILLMPRKGKS